MIVSASPNSPPVLDWASADCLAEGVRPPSGADGADFEFMVRYTDPENQCPAPLGGDIVVWVDDDDSRVKILSTAWEDLRGVHRLRRTFRDRAGWTAMLQSRDGGGAV